MNRVARIDSLLISYMEYRDDPDDNLLLVGTKTAGQSLDILNAITGERAKKIYDELLRKEGGDADA